MMKKFYISLLILVVFLSTTGVYSSFYNCEMMESSSPDKCSMCQVEELQQPDKCCEMNDDYKETVKSEEPVCCDIKVVDEKLSDDFLVTIKNNSEKESLLKIILVSENFENSNAFSKIDISVNAHSPPQNIPIYITNSVLLI